jgi:hypothetical protein
MTFYTVVLPPLLGLLAGTIGSLVAPWVNWGIEKRRIKDQHHRELVANWRVLLHDVTDMGAYEAKKPGDIGIPWFILRVKNHPYYPSLQPHLRDVTLEALEQTGGKPWDAAIVQYTYGLLLEDVNTAEREWDLV